MKTSSFHRILSALVFFLRQLNWTDFLEKVFDQFLSPSTEGTKLQRQQQQQQKKKKKQSNQTDAQCIEERKQRGVQATIVKTLAPI